MKKKLDEENVTMGRLTHLLDDRFSVFFEGIKEFVKATVKGSEANSKREFRSVEASLSRGIEITQMALKTTKEDLSTKLKEEAQSVLVELKATTEKLTTEIDNVRIELKTTRADIKGDISNLEKEIHGLKENVSDLKRELPHWRIRGCRKGPLVLRGSFLL